MQALDAEEFAQPFGVHGVPHLQCQDLLALAACSPRAQAFFDSAPQWPEMWRELQLQHAHVRVDAALDADQVAALPSWYDPSGLRAPNLRVRVCAGVLCAQAHIERIMQHFHWGESAHPGARFDSFGAWGVGRVPYESEATYDHYLDKAHLFVHNRCRYDLMEALMLINLARLDMQGDTESALEDIQTYHFDSMNVPWDGNGFDPGTGSSFASSWCQLSDDAFLRVGETSNHGTHGAFAHMCTRNGGEGIGCDAHIKELLEGHATRVFRHVVDEARNTFTLEDTGMWTGQRIISKNLWGAEMAQVIDILAEPRAIGLATLCARFPKSGGNRPAGWEAPFEM